MSRPALVAAGIVAVVVALAAALLATRGDDHRAGIPPLGSKAPPSAYRILYEITTPDGRSSEEHIVRRPFLAEVIERDGADHVTAERWSSLGRLVTRSQGAKAVRIDTAVATSASDLRPDLFVDDLESAGKLHPGTNGDVGGRACRRTTEPSKIATAPSPGATGKAAEPGSVPVTVARCVDAQGLVLEEDWTSAGGKRVLTKRAVELQLGDDVPKIDIPDAKPLPAGQGNGAVRKVAATKAPPFLETWSLAAPKGFTFVGRYAVVPARLSQGGGALTSEPSIALYTDVWRRGPDVLLLDQGANAAGAAPFDPQSTIGPILIPGIGSAQLAIDLRLAEVRITRPEGGFVRVAGTIEPRELVRLAATLERVGAAT